MTVLSRIMVRRTGWKHASRTVVVGQTRQKACGRPRAHSKVLTSPLTREPDRPRRLRHAFALGGRRMDGRRSRAIAARAGNEKSIRPSGFGFGPDFLCARYDGRG